MPRGESEISDTFHGEAKAWQGFLTPASKSQVLVASELGKVRSGVEGGSSGWSQGCVLPNGGGGNKEVKKTEGVPCGGSYPRS